MPIISVSSVIFKKHWVDYESEVSDASDAPPFQEPVQRRRLMPVVRHDSTREQNLPVQQHGPRRMEEVGEQGFNLIRAVSNTSNTTYPSTIHSPRSTITSSSQSTQSQADLGIGGPREVLYLCPKASANVTSVQLSAIHMKEKNSRP